MLICCHGREHKRKRDEVSTVSSSEQDRQFRHSHGQEDDSGRMHHVVPFEISSCSMLAHAGV